MFRVTDILYKSHRYLISNFQIVGNFLSNSSKIADTVKV